ncbi:MAG: arginase family protein, partial [Paracoccus sp. (in: a-proteobacteria)]
MTHCILIGAPVDEGQRRPGCLMGPAAYRTAGLAGTLTALGHTIEDRGDVVPDRPGNGTCANAAVHHLPETIAWTNALREAVAAALPEGMPIIMGGDHSLALGSVAGVAAHAAQTQRPQFVIWLDAHSDFHTLRTTTTGNLHGTPMAYASGLPGFGPFPPFPAPIPGENICMFGIRSVDPAEHAAMQDTEITVNDMRVMDEQGIVAPLRAFLSRVRATGGLLHVSLDVDFLDPSIAPAVGTTVPG